MTEHAYNICSFQIHLVDHVCDDILVQVLLLQIAGEANRKERLFAALLHPLMFHGLIQRDPLLGIKRQKARYNFFTGYENNLSEGITGVLFIGICELGVSSA